MVLGGVHTRPWCACVCDLVSHPVAHPLAGGGAEPLGTRPTSRVADCASSELLLCTTTTAGQSLHPPCDCLAHPAGVLLLYECYTTATVVRINACWACLLTVCLETAALCAGQLRGLWCLTAEQGPPSVMINQWAEATDLCSSDKKTLSQTVAGDSRRHVVVGTHTVPP